MKHLATISVLMLTCFFSNAQKAGESDVTLVKKACFNYIDAFYKADTMLAYASVHPLLQKRGFTYSKTTSVYSKQLEMPFSALVKLATTWNKDGARTNEQSPRQVQVFEVSDKTASAKVTAVWGIDYLHLVKENGTWYIMNVLWQSPALTTSGNEE